MTKFIELENQRYLNNLRSSVEGFTDRVLELTNQIKEIRYDK